MTKNRSNCVEKIKIYEKSLYISYQNKIEDEFPNIWLRDHAKDDENWDSRSHQRKTFTAKLDNDLHIKEANIIGEGESINILWSDLKKPIEYSSEFLFSNSSKSEKRKKNIKLWNSKDIKNQIYIKYEDIISEKGFKNFISNLYQYGFSVITHCQTEMKTVETIANKIGYVRQSIFGGLWSFESNKDMADSAYTQEELRPHTDSTYSIDAPGLQLLLCCEYDAVGGDSIMVDGFKIAETIKKESKDIYNTLSKIEVPGNYIGDGVYLEAKRPIFRHDKNEEILQVSFNNYDRAAFRIDNESTLKFYEGIKKFDILANSEDYQWRYILKPGDLLIFNNWRILHGRGSFNGTRKMKGCYINKEDFDSCCKMNGLY